MLERIKACLQSGAPETLRCASTPHRSKRILHSTFWQHGAGDLDLPAWAVSMLPMRSDLPLKPYDSPQSDERKSGGQVEDKAKVWATTSDGLFSDFLYPPQALAWLKRTSGHQWERRNAKRLPEGFIQASRSYASRSRGQAALARIQRDRGLSPGPRGKGDAFGSAWVDTLAGGDRARYTGKDIPSSRDKLGATGADALPSEVGSGPAAEDSKRLGENAEAAPSSAPDHHWPDADSADSPGDLAESQSDAMQRLRSMLAGTRRVKREDPATQFAPTERVLKTYDSLDPASKDVIRLKFELLIWLSLQRNSVADVRCAELYHALPVTHRTLSVYQAALSIFLRRGLHVQAVKLHREALKNIPNGDQVTKTFFEYAINERRWQLAMNVEAQYRLQNAKGTAGEEIFWLHVSEMPKLIVKALALSKHVHALYKAKTVNQQVRRFCGRFYAEALVQEFQTTDSSNSEPSFSANGIPKGSIGRLFGYLDHLGDDAPRFYERMILSLLKQKHTNYRYPQVHRIVSYVYLALRKTKHQVSKGILMALLEKLTWYWGRLQAQRELYHSITVSTILADWQRYHGKLNKAALKHVLSWHASSGRRERFEHWLQYYKEHHPIYEDQKSVLASTIYLHARRADLRQAQVAFEEAVKLTAEHGETPPLMCSNVLIHAYSRADDLEGGLRSLQALIDKELKPDEFSFHPVMEMLAKRGDVEGVKDLLAQYDALAQKKREAAFFGSLLTAHVNCGEIKEAEAVLKGAIHEVKTGKVRGSLTGSFNILLTAYALRRDVDATMQTYRWMKSEGIRMDSYTYAALIQALTTHRQTDAAYKILRVVMRDEHLEPTAFHYALVMTGYVNQGLYEDALAVRKAMQDRNVRPTFSSNVIFLKAKALKERAESRRSADQPREVEPLKQTIHELRNVLKASNGSDLAEKQPGLGRGLEASTSTTPAAYFNFLIYIHGRRHCFDAVKELCREYRDTTRSSGQLESEAPIQLLAALMCAHLRAGEHEDVERCWSLANEQADELARIVPVPQLKPAVADRQLERDLLQLQPLNLEDAQEVGFQYNDRLGTDMLPPQHSSPQPSLQAKQILITEKTDRPPALKSSLARQHILTRPLRFYLYALAAKGRVADILSTVAKLFGQGYKLDNRTWNVLIELLCRASPPLVLLAFTLTERFLIPSFPGWAPVSAHKTYIPNPAAKVEGLQYIRARYLRPGQLMPQYRTLVVLGSALLSLRRVETTGRRGMPGHDIMKGMEKYVGTVRQVRKQAPKTVSAVQSMPTVHDALQTRLLRRR